MTLIADLLDASHKKFLRPSGSCSTCPRKRIDFVPPTLKKGSIIFVIGEPGEADVENQEMLTGATGEILRKHCDEYSITDFSITSILHCRKGDKGKKKEKAISCCLSQFLLDEIRGYPLVVLLGSEPIKALFPGVKANRLRGNITRHPDFPGQKFYSTYDPAFLFRNRDKEGEFRQQMERLGRISRGESDPGFTVLQGGSSLYWEALEGILEAPLISLDFETNKLESWHIDARIRSVALTADAETVCFSDENDTTFIATLEKIRDYLLDPTKHVVGHNIGFDLDFIERELDFRIRTLGIHDTATIWYEVGQYIMPSLKELQAIEGDGYRFLSYSSVDEEDPEWRAMYNAEDVVYTLQLFRKGMAKASAKTRNLLMRVSGPSGYILRKTTTNGFFVRQKYLDEMLSEYQERTQQVMMDWKAEDPEFIPTVHNTGKGLAKYLFEIKRLPDDRKTPSGKPAMDEGAIKEWIRGGASYLKHLLKLRGMEKIESTYLRGYKKQLGSDSRLHSSFTNTFTDTARSSSRKPNVQNVERSKPVRNLFGAPPGELLMESDFSQMEFRIMVCLARDLSGIEAYQQGLDAHTLTAQSFAPDPTDEHRTWAKVINFALLYGGDAYKVQQWARDQYGLDWSFKQAEQFVEIFFQTYPMIPQFHTDCDIRLTENRGWFTSVTGHNFHYRDWDHPNTAKRDHAFRAHINSQAQGPAAQITFMTMFHADRLLLERGMGDIKMVNTVHDSILTEIPSEELIGPITAAIEDGRDIAYEWVKDWMIVPLLMDHKIGPSWGAMKEVA